MGIFVSLLDIDQKKLLSYISTINGKIINLKIHPHTKVWGFLFIFS